MQSICLQLRSLTIVGPSLLQNTAKVRFSPFILSQGNAGGYLIPAAAMSAFNSQSQDLLWKTMQGVSPQGKRRGRAKNLLKRKDLNRGQVIGFGKEKLAFPGLTHNTTEVVNKQTNETKLTKIRPMKDSVYQNFEVKLKVAREGIGQNRSRYKGSPLERGWTGNTIRGKKFGAPLADNKELKFNNFDSVLLDFKTTNIMKGVLGRTKRTSALMVTGNGNGTVGFTLNKGKYAQNARTLRAATNKAGLRLVNIERYEDRTVYHDFFTQYGKCRIFVEQRPAGYGIVAHRAVKAICEMAGIKDIYAKVGNNKNPVHITKAFILGLLRQKTHQAMADEKQLHLVEMRPEEDYYPRLVASPSDGKVRTQEEIGHNEVLDFQITSHEGNLPNEKIDKKSPFIGTPGWDKHLRTGWAIESHERVRRRMRVEHGDVYGSVRSHLYDKYPECIEFKMERRKQDAE
eukprot:TRINITY_DN6609_c0_g1_i6.p1 TRINITY_DN6609_c0_g1~~TRINITY_DN6609_c0_g1_i6.p1  ORF type:complete len:457 (-),score=88.25 TRINITY_DN6609_c0_g1_i6:368-1738(-)